MIVKSINPKVTVANKVREYYTVDKKLAGLITVTETVYTEKMGREVLVVLPEMNRDDRVLINGIEFVPKEQK